MGSALGEAVHRFLHVRLLAAMARMIAFVAGRAPFTPVSVGLPLFPLLALSVPAAHQKATLLLLKV